MITLDEKRFREIIKEELSTKSKETTLLYKLIGEVARLRAMIAQLGPVECKTPLDQEIAAVLAQGLNIGDYLRQKGKAKG